MTARARPRRQLSRRGRLWLLTVHLIVAIGLLGDSAGYLAVAIRTSTLDDPALVRDSVKTLNMFSFAFGIPLSIATLVTGVALGLGTRWGVFRHPWVVAKLVLVASVMVVGTAVIGPASQQMLDEGTDETASLIAGGAYDVVALAVATGLGVFKPGKAFRRSTTAH